MHRPQFSNPPPAQTPPLHHPVPQHVSTVPQLRSPPPLSQSQPQQQHGGYGPAGGYASGIGIGGDAGHQHHQQGPGGGPGGGGYPGHPNFSGFFSDPAAQMSLQVGKTALSAGQEYMEQNLGRFMKATVLKRYFDVSNVYVVQKLGLVLFPWRHKPWSRQQRISHNGQDMHYLPPREDVNSPDMYIPLMSAITYVLLRTLLAGMRGQFHPELLGSIAATAFVVVAVEIMGLKAGCYVLNISNESQLLDLVAYSGYKFVGVIVTIALAAISNGSKSGTGGWVGWLVFGYTFLANALFLLRSLRYVLLPEHVSQPGASSTTTFTIARAQRYRRTQFLFVYSYLVQFLLMWILTR